MMVIVRPVGKFFKSGFKSTGMTVEKVLYNYEGSKHMGYVIYQNSIIFWLPCKDKVAHCSSYDELVEVNKRCELNLNLNL